MEDRFVYDTKYQFLICILLKISIYTSALDTDDSHVCYPAINGTEKLSSFEISISLHKQSFEEIIMPDVSKCTFGFELPSNESNEAIEITLSNTNPYRHRTCITFSSINIKVDIEGKPVKTLNCSDSGSWTVSWPWRIVVVEINLSHNSFTYHLDESTANLTIMAASIPRWNQYKPFRNLISMPFSHYWYEHKIPQYCLGDFYYQIIYRNRYGTITHDIDKERKVKFLLVQRSVCIRTGPFDKSIKSGSVVCPWRVYLSIRNEVLMVLKCESIDNYWCLPIAWIKRPHEFLEIYFISVDQSNTSGSYTIGITSNESYASYRNYECQLDTTTTSTTTTTTWSPNDDLNSGIHQNSSSSAKIYVPIIVFVVFIFTFVCVASYMRSKRRNSRNYRRQRRLQIAYASTADSGELPRNPAYRTHDPVRDPNPAYRTYDQVGETNISDTGGTEHQNSYSDPPPNYAGVLAATPPNHSELSPPLFTTQSSPSDLQTAPPPSYEDALTMIDSTHI